jgi:hypothetical protein
MPRLDAAEDGAEAVRRFADELRSHSRPPGLIRARVDGADGVTALCAAETAIAALWPPATAKELVWLTRAAATDGDLLHLEARAADGEILCATTFRLVGRSRSAA